MKKALKTITLALVIVLVSGCGKKEVVKTCTLTQNNTAYGYKLESKYVIYGEGDIAKKVESTETVTTDNTSIQDQFETQLNSTYKSLNDTYGGYTYKVTKGDGKVVSTVTIDYEKLDIEKYVKDNSAMKNYVNKDNKLLVEGIESIYKALGATCEESK